ncbi:D-glucuronyl C5-epimerase family protein [Robiginitomaculum antarcticum]|uniref:D-glucuronyl C5-epimerase family protein n=1 Tax=Robiginitomaculum antarcticum TaxID=437507 RepID=UPI00037D2D4D|nr:D-glucuronyl C5-epimerase family protein [Robiginitomaculum antarcticum]
MNPIVDMGDTKKKLHAIYLGAILISASLTSAACEPRKTSESQISFPAPTYIPRVIPGSDSVKVDISLPAFVPSSDEVEIAATKAPESALLDDFGAAQAGLPPVREARREHYVYYRLQFLPDGYPGILKTDGVTAHPIYGSYLLYEYIYLHRTQGKKTTIYLDAAKRVADATLRRMDYIEEFDALGFFYTDQDGLTYWPGRFISGLTQARYLPMFYDLYIVTGEEKYKVAATQILNSLKIPQNEGGVMIMTPFGVAVEEYPHEIPTYVLNGWTTIILEMLRYHDKSGDQAALDFATENIKTVEKMMPLYDYPNLLLSRYQLTGFAYMKVRFKKQRNCGISGFSTSVAGVWHDDIAGEDNRWHNFIHPKGRGEDGFAEKREQMINVVLSRIDEDRKVKVDVVCKEDDEAIFFIGNGDYMPTMSAMPTKRWIEVGRASIPVGSSTVSMTFSADNMELLGYPTNFAKEIGGIRRNVYHWLHINNLELISEFYQSDVFTHYIGKWRSYTDQWKSLPVLKDGGFDFTNPKPSEHSEEE